MRALAELYKAFTDPTRLDMIVLMSRHGELCVCDFEGVLGLSQSAASRHLRRLYQAGVADSRRGGPWVYYRLTEPLEPPRDTLVRVLLEQVPADRIATLDRAHATWMSRKDQGATCPT
jgi:ArsR family transcriptional regulator